MNDVPFQEIPIPPGIVVFNFWALPAPDNTQCYGALVTRTTDVLSKFEGLSATIKQQCDIRTVSWDDIVRTTLNDIVKAVETKGGANRHMLDPQEMMTDFIMLIWAMSESGYSPEEMRHLRMGVSLAYRLCTWTNKRGRQWRSRYSGRTKKNVCLSCFASISMCAK